MPAGHGIAVEHHDLSDALNDTRTFLPMNRAGTEYFTIRTVIIEDRSTRGVRTKPGSKTSAGSGANVSKRKASGDVSD